MHTQKVYWGITLHSIENCYFEYSYSNLIMFQECYLIKMEIIIDKIG